MTLFSAPQATKALVLAVALAAGGMNAADARDSHVGTGWSDTNTIGRSIARRDRSRDDWLPRDRWVREHRRGERHREHRGHKDRNFYGGAITAYRDFGNGIYFYIDRDHAGGTNDLPRVESRGPQIIEVIPGRNGCSWEAGVCVVRP